MGLFGRLKSFAGKTLSGLGNVTKSVADVGSKVVRKIDEWAPKVANVGSGIALALGQPEIAGILQAGNKLIQKVSPTVQNVLNKAGQYAPKLQEVGNALRS